MKRGVGWEIWTQKHTEQREIDGQLHIEGGYNGHEQWWGQAATGNFGKSEQSQKKILELQAAPEWRDFILDSIYLSEAWTENFCLA